MRGQQNIKCGLDCGPGRHRRGYLPIIWLLKCQISLRDCRRLQSDPYYYIILFFFTIFNNNNKNKVWLRLTTFDFKNVNLLTEIVQWLQINQCYRTAQSYSWCSSNFNLVIWLKGGMGTWLHKLKILRLRTAKWDDNFVKTMSVFRYFSINS